jgi:hypothetical protein
MKMIKKFSEFNESVKWEMRSGFNNDVDEMKVYTFKIANHTIDVGISEIEEGKVKFDFMVDGSYNKSIDLDPRDSVQLFTTLRDILNDYVDKHKPYVITFLPSDRDQSALKKKEKINTLINIPGYNKRKIGISTVFTKEGYQEED